MRRASYDLNQVAESGCSAIDLNLIERDSVVLAHIPSTEGGGTECRRNSHIGATSLIASIGSKSVRSGKSKTPKNFSSLRSVVPHGRVDLVNETPGERKVRENLEALALIKADELK
jgi:hypothetical protein